MLTVGIILHFQLWLAELKFVKLHPRCRTDANNIRNKKVVEETVNYDSIHLSVIVVE